MYMCVYIYIARTCEHALSVVNVARVAAVKSVKRIE
jgi:hypothetical protein